jgi:hypothetical protein
VSAKLGHTDREIKHVFELAREQAGLIFKAEKLRSRGLLVAQNLSGHLAADAPAGPGLMTRALWADSAAATFDEIADRLRLIATRLRAIEAEVERDFDELEAAGVSDDRLFQLACLFERGVKHALDEELKRHAQALNVRRAQANAFRRRRALRITVPARPAGHRRAPRRRRVTARHSPRDPPSPSGSDEPLDPPIPEGSA